MKLGLVCGNLMLTITSGGPPESIIEYWISITVESLEELSVDENSKFGRTCKHDRRLILDR